MGYVTRCIPRPLELNSSISTTLISPWEVWHLVVYMLHAFAAIDCVFFVFNRLTAFVLKSFAQAREFIEIDNNVLAEAKRWILRKQTKDGCFPSVGTLHHKAMKVNIISTFNCLSCPVTSLFQCNKY